MFYRKAKDLVRSNGRTKKKVGFGDVSIEEVTNSLNQLKYNCDNQSVNDHEMAAKPKRKPLIKVKRIDEDEVSLKISMFFSISISD